MFLSTFSAKKCFCSLNNKTTTNHNVNYDSLKIFCKFKNFTKQEQPHRCSCFFVCVCTHRDHSFFACKICRQSSRGSSSLLHVCAAGTFPFHVFDQNPHRPFVGQKTFRQVRQTHTKTLQLSWTRGIFPFDELPFRLPRWRKNRR